MYTVEWTEKSNNTTEQHLILSVLIGACAHLWLTLSQWPSRHSEHRNYLWDAHEFMDFLRWDISFDSVARAGVSTLNCHILVIHSVNSFFYIVQFTRIVLFLAPIFKSDDTPACLLKRDLQTLSQRKYEAETKKINEREKNRCSFWSRYCDRYLSKCIQFREWIELTL